MATQRGCKPEELIEGLLWDAADDMGAVRATLDSRYDDMISGNVKMLSPKEAKQALEEKGQEWLSKRG